MIQDVLNQIKRTTNLNNLFQQNLIIGNYLNRLSNVQSALKSFESNLENTRSAVLNSTRRLKLDEVNELTEALGEIGRESVELKVRQISLRNFRPPITQQQQQINVNNNHPLDAILDELGENNRKQQNGTNEIQASFTLRLGSNKDNEGGNIW
uniref:Uncharacterized protein n=1 Tax=Meloidogyne hapla TaxID=6305 RepID=A0A1I8BSC7_MELHA